MAISEFFTKSKSIQINDLNYYFAEIIKDDIITRLEILETNYAALEIQMNTSEMILSTLESEYDDFMNILNSIKCK